MKFSILFSALILCALSSKAQVLTSNEPRSTTMGSSGEVILLPAQSRSDAPAVSVAATAERKVLNRNLSQKREPRISKMRNGYYLMPGQRDWGTNARMSSYGRSTSAL